jgi:uncharacterized protein
MYLVDANILVYSTDEDSEHHATARDWLDEQTAGAPRSVGLPWPSLMAFFRLVTNPRIYSADTDFARFPSVAWLNPVSAATA